MNDQRIRILKDGVKRSGPILYWMSRDQRARDNWALFFAQKMALDNKVPLGVVFCLAPRFLGATMRQYEFMLKGLVETMANLEAKNIPFFLLKGSPEKEVADFVQRRKAGALITDFDPLRLKRTWKKGVLKRVEIPVYEVDAHNIIPCWEASPKQEFAAYTFRPKVKRLLDKFLDEFPPLRTHPFPWRGRVMPTDWEMVRGGLNVDRKVPEAGWITVGEKAARKRLNHFILHKLVDYDAARNDPNKDGQSNLSPYLHFGQISAQRVALEVKKKKPNAAGAKARRSS